MTMLHVFFVVLDVSLLAFVIGASSLALYQERNFQMKDSKALVQRLANTPKYSAICKADNAK
jgi:hypothetical protein